MIDKIEINDLKDGYKLKTPLTAKVEKEGDEYIAIVDGLAEGRGSTVAEMQEDIQNYIVTIYKILCEKGSPVDKQKSFYDEQEKRKEWLHENVQKAA